MYGGRAIDSFDRRILTTYMEEYFGDFIFDTFQPYHFYANKEVDYCIPEDTGGKEAYTTMIETLPLGSVQKFVLLYRKFFTVLMTLKIILHECITVKSKYSRSFRSSSKR